MTKRWYRPPTADSGVPGRVIRHLVPERCRVAELNEPLV